MAILKKDSTQKSLEIYLDRLKKQGFLPQLNSDSSAKLKDKIAAVDENVLPTPLPESGKPRGCWKQMFGQAVQWRNSAVCATEEPNDSVKTAAATVSLRR